jgi:hypothetical protein
MEKTKTDELISGYIERERSRDWTKPCDEMVRLRGLLNAEGIGWNDASWKNTNRYLWRTLSDAVHVNDGGFEFRVFEVVWGEFTYGGPDGLLEVHTYDSDDPIGNLSADGALKICRDAIDRHLESLGKE